MTFLLALLLQDGDAVAGAKAFADQCAKCHFVAEPAAVKRDEAWTNLIKTTS